jgi:putative NADH-flavin reductase
MIAAQAALAVTGSTGRLGGRVVHGLSKLGVNQRLVVRDPAKAPAFARHSCRDGRLWDRAAVRTALTGCLFTCLAIDGWAHDRPTLLPRGTFCISRQTLRSLSGAWHSGST